MQGRKIKIAPSILSADFSRLGEQVRDAVDAGADYIHVDVMDGHFVPNISIGLPVVQSLRRITSIPLDVHLMIEKPELYIERFAGAGADILTVHVEACTHLDGAVNAIKKLGLKAGVSLNPATPLSSLDEVLCMVDLLLVMTVNPGFGGQEFIAGMVDKIARLKQTIYNRKSGAEIEVDGGITAVTAPIAAGAGADILVAGSAIFNSSLGVGLALKGLRDSVC
ncbi:MAG: ribulose-phosphate 3-epimerase [Chloroflexi bacterium]|nr:ribulose-phosphate 3-epimerase [Chloroflexota bacterium]